jgi:hypothetical protein
MDITLAPTPTANLLQHGRIACRRCFSSDDSTQTIGKWQMVNDPAAWGSANPTILILGFSKGFTQANAFRSGRFEDIPFKDMRTRLTEEMRMLGVIGKSEIIDQKMVATETEIGFGSLVRCSLSRVNKKGVLACTGEVMPKAIDDYEALIDRSEIWLERTQGIGLLSADDALALGQSGPVLRGSGVDWDLRRAQPYLAYDQVDFRVPVYEEGDVYARYRVRMEEMRESVRIVEQAMRRMPDGPWISDDRKVVLPPREELHTSMESLIHHFKIVTEGFRVPEGEVYVTIESPRGELGCYVVSDGGPKPWRVKFRAPSFVALEATATCMRQALVADMIAIVGSLDTVMGEVDR